MHEDKGAPLKILTHSLHQNGWYVEESSKRAFSTYNAPGTLPSALCALFHSSAT